MKKVSNLVSTILSSLVFALMPVVSQAIGLGNIMLHSHLNEPLEADIALTDLKGFDPSDVLVNVADQKDYEEAGLQPIGWLTSIRFQVIKSEEGGRPVLKLKTKEVVKDPFVDLLIEVKWPGGRLLREYTLLLDPPKSVIPTTRSIQKKHKISPVIGAYVDRPIEKISHAGPVVSRHVYTTPGGTYGPIQDESLWSIAKSLSHNTHSNVHQAVMAIAEKNPHAFRDGNINYMLSGAVLKLPDKAELEQYSLEQSQYYIAMQGQTPYHEPRYTHTNSEDIAKAVVHKAHKPLKLVAPVQSLATAVKVNSEAPVKSGTQTVMAERLTLIEEAIDTLKRNNEDMTRKNQSLQVQNQSLEKLLSMKEDEIKKLVDMVKQPTASVTSTQTSSHEVHEQFAVAVSDVSPKQVGDAVNSTGLTTPDLADLTRQTVQQVPQSHPEPIAKVEPNLAISENKPNAIKVDNIAPYNQAQPKVITADEPSLQISPAKPLGKQEISHSSTNILLWILMLGFSVIVVVLTWMRRNTLLELLEPKIQAFFVPRQKDMQAAVAVGAGQEITNYGLQFNLERALDAIAAQEKKFKKPTSLGQKQAKDIIDSENPFKTKFEDAEECISYERFGQAEKIFKEILQHQPDEWSAVFKLSELYVLTEKYAEFESLYEGLPSDLKDVEPRVWSKIETLRSKVANEKAIHFQSPDKTPFENQRNVSQRSGSASTSEDYLDLKKDYRLALEDESDSIDIEALPSPSVEIHSESEEPVGSAVPDIQKAQISLAKAYIDMGEFNDAKDILIALKKDASGDNLKQIDALLESISDD